MPAVYFSASFGDIPMLVSSINTERGRDIAVQSPAQGDRHTLADRGKRLVRATCEILFVDQAGQAPYTDRYEALVAAWESGDAQIFTHPLDGSYTARVENVSIMAEADGLEIRASCTFIRDDEPQTVFPVAAGSLPTAGVEAVTVAVDSANVALEAAEIDTDLPASCLDTVTAWSESLELDSQQVLLEVASLTQQIDELIDLSDIAGTLDLWDVYKELIGLRYEVVRAGQLFTIDAETTFDLFVDQPRPVLAICAEVYGAADAFDFADRVTQINRLRMPGRVPAGTTLKMPAVTS